MSLNRRDFLRSVAQSLPAMIASQFGTPSGNVVSRNVIVLLPGITGSTLSVHGRDVWAPSPSGLARAIVTLGRSFDNLKLPNDSLEVDDLGDGVVADRLVSDLHLIPGLWKIDGYTKISNEILRLPGVVRGSNFFEFPYDWRRDNRYSARRLANFSRQKLREWQLSSGAADAKLVFVAHSMGGLIARYFIECMEGWKETSKLVTFGTPFRGSVNSLSTLHEGFAVGALSAKIADLGPLLRTFSSIYQLLPTYPCIVEGSHVLRVAEAGKIDNLDTGRAASAARFHAEILEAATTNSRDDAYLRSGYSLHPVVGISQPTKQGAMLSNGKLHFLMEDASGFRDGDGTVPRPSAIPIGADGVSPVYIVESHGSLQNTSSAIAQVSGLLSESLIDWDRFRQPSIAASISVSDAVPTDMPIEFSGSYDHKVLDDRIAVSLTDISSGRLVSEKSVGGRDGKFVGSFSAVPEGAYRVSAAFARTDNPDVTSTNDTFVSID